MDTVLSRYRNLIVLALVLSTQVVGLAVQVKRNVDREPTRLIRFWSVSAITPLEKIIVNLQTRSRDMWSTYLDLRGVRRQNEDLKAQIEQMRLEQVRLSEDARQAHRLQVLLGFKEQYLSQTVAAQVVGSSGSEQSRAVYIDKGQHDGLKPDMPVITADGVVGKVLRVYPATAEVLLLNDQTSGVGAILEKSRLQGVIRGTPSGSVVMEKVMSDENVQPGDRVLTSGGDRIFPKGLTVGTVTKSSPGAELFLNIQVKPTADLARLEEVLVVTKINEKAPSPEETGPVRAIDILAERLPSVPPKPDATAVPGQQKPGVAGAPVVPGNLASSPTATNNGLKPGAIPKATGTAAMNGAPGTALSPNSMVKPPVTQPGTAKPATPTNAATAKPATVGAGATRKTPSGVAGGTSQPGLTTDNSAKPAAPKPVVPASAGTPATTKPPSKWLIAPDTVSHPGQAQKPVPKPATPSDTPPANVEPGPQ